jgi:AAA ATPase domain/AAA domain, putative AbiEii toxin, Type IV TA system
MSTDAAPRLDAITLENFRGVRRGEVRGLADVNVVIGRNNAGKSTLIEAITRAADALARAGDPNDADDVLGRRRDGLWGAVRAEPDSFPAELWYRADSANVPSIQMFFGDESSTVTGVWKPAVPRVLDVAQVTTKAPRDFARWVTLYRPPDATNQSIERQLWRQLLATRQDKALARSLSTIFGVEVEGLQLPPDGRMMVLFPDVGLPLDVQGDGVRAAVRCLMVLTVLRKTLLLVEEPECHQHPGSLRRFAAAVCAQAKVQEVQLLLTTHSLECVQAFLDGAAEAGSEGAVFHLSLSDGMLDARRLAPDTFGTLRDSGLDPRFLDAYA